MNIKQSNKKVDFMTLKELAEKGKKILSSQPPVTYEEAKEQVRELKAQSIQNKKKKRNKSKSV